MQRFLVYAFCRENGTFYYIGKGTKKRPYSKRRQGIKPPRDKSRILILHENLDEETAFDYERKLILFYGRKDMGTGLLRNMTDGGEGVSGWIPSENWRSKKSKSMSGKGNPMHGKRHPQETIRLIIEKTKQTKQRKIKEGLTVKVSKQTPMTKQIKIQRAIEKSARKRGLQPFVGKTGDANPMHGRSRPDLARKNKEHPFDRNLKWMNNGQVELRLLPKDAPEGFIFGRLGVPGNSKPIKVTRIQTREFFVFGNAKQAAEALSLSEKALRTIANGKQDSHRGYSAEFISKDEL